MDSGSGSSRGGGGRVADTRDSDRMNAPSRRAPMPCAMVCSVARTGREPKRASMAACKAVHRCLASPGTKELLRHGAVRGHPLALPLRQANGAGVGGAQAAHGARHGKQHGARPLTCAARPASERCPAPRRGRGPAAAPPARSRARPRRRERREAAGEVSLGQAHVRVAHAHEGAGDTASGWWPAPPRRPTRASCATSASMSMGAPWERARSRAASLVCTRSWSPSREGRATRRRPR
jgi:hypothetical protein